MKGIYTTALMLCLLASADHSNAAAVSAQAAQAVALNFIKGNAPALAASAASLSYTRTESDGTVDYYVFDLSPAPGFVIVSADDDILPVIGYSTESSFRSSPEYLGLKSWMDRTASIIHGGILQHAPADARISGLWTAYRQGPYAPATRSGSVGPLCTTTWDQENDFTSPPPYIYNQFCPFYNPDHQRALTGCVATAMGQIMKYWNYPAQGVGSFTYTDNTTNGYSNNYGTLSANFGTAVYNWTQMPQSLTPSTTGAQDSAVGILLYHCAVSVGMDFGDDLQNGSGANALIAEELQYGDSFCSQYALTKYFSYNPHTIQGVFDSSYTQGAWIALLENELDKGRPILYEGNDATQGGHAWVCDGYDPNDMLHMNWGWNGFDDGYFAITNFTTAGNFNPILGMDALIGIQPLYPFSLAAVSTDAIICQGSSTTLNASGPGGATYTWTPATGLSCAACAVTDARPATTTVYTVTADSAGVQASFPVTISVLPAIGTAFTIIPDSSWISFLPNDPAIGYFWNFGNGDTSSLQDPYEVYNAGTYAVTLIETNGNCSDTLMQSVTIYSTGIAEINSGGSISVSPNPAQDQLRVKISSPLADHYQLMINNVLGQILLSKEIQLSSGSNSIDQDISAFAPGLYTISIQSTNGRMTGKFVKE